MDKLNQIKQLCIDALDTPAQSILDDIYDLAVDSSLDDCEGCGQAKAELGDFCFDCAADIPT